jgi:hypothetical protein
MSTIEQRAKELGKEIQKLYEDAVAEGEAFEVTFNAPSLLHDEAGEIDRAGFSLAFDEDYEEDDEGNDVEKLVPRANLEYSWYSSSLNC